MFWHGGFPLFVMAYVWLTKPLDVQQLLDLVDQALAGQTAAERER
jgi:hypothetical protein